MFSLPVRVTKIFFPDIPKKNFPDLQNTFLQTYENFAGHNRKFFITHVIFAKIQNFFQYIKILPKFLCFARISHRFLPDRKNLGGGGTVPPVPPGPYAYVL
jgi:hypothetical protein